MKPVVSFVDWSTVWRYWYSGVKCCNKFCLRSTLWCMLLYFIL